MTLPFSRSGTFSTSLAKSLCSCGFSRKVLAPIEGIGADSRQCERKDRPSVLSDEEIRRVADDLLAGLRARTPRSRQDLDAQLDAFQAAFHAIQKERGTPVAIARCAPALEVLEESARIGGFALPEWFAEIVSIVHLQATRDKIKAATEGLAKALEDVARGTKES